MVVSISVEWRAYETGSERSYARKIVLKCRMGERWPLQSCATYLTVKTTGAPAALGSDRKRQSRARRLTVSIIGVPPKFAFSISRLPQLSFDWYMVYGSGGRFNLNIHGRTSNCYLPYLATKVRRLGSGRPPVPRLLHTRLMSATTCGMFMQLQGCRSCLVRLGRVFLKPLFSGP